MFKKTLTCISPLVPVSQVRSRIYFLPLLFFCCFASQAEIQYKPVGSPIRNEVAVGWSLARNDAGPFATKQSLILNYSLYFPEINDLLPQPWPEAGFLGLSAGVRFFKSRPEGLCGESARRIPFLAHGGLKARLSYFDFIIPFVSGGLAKTACLSVKEGEIFKLSGASAAGGGQMKAYVSVGLDLSFKILDRKSIYSMDQDYGLNDLSFQGRCLRYYGAKNVVVMCEAALSLLF